MLVRSDRTTGAEPQMFDQTVCACKSSIHKAALHDTKAKLHIHPYSLLSLPLGKVLPDVLYQLASRWSGYNSHPNSLMLHVCVCLI